MAFDLLNNTDITQRAQEALISIRSRRKNANEVTLGNYNDFPKLNGLLVEPINLQWALGFKQFLPGTILELIGGDGIGKTTLVFSLMGMFMRSANSPCLFVNSEGSAKRLDNDRMASCLHTNRDIAYKLLSTISMDRGSALKDTLENIDEWVKMMREKVNVPLEIPLVVAIDTLSKLVPPSEATMIGFKEDGAKAKRLGESSNLEFSKLMHEWCRSRATFLEMNNVFMIVVSHQNENINMSRGFNPTAFMSDEQKAANNKTKIGGKALNQSASVQMSVTRIQGIKDSNGVVESHMLSLKVLKNSLGPDQRSCTYRLRKENLKDTPDTFEPALDFYSSIAEFFVKNDLFDTKESRKRYTSEELNLIGMTAYDFGKAVQENQSILDKVGEILHIRGYKNPMLDSEEFSSDEEVYEKDESSEEDTNIPTEYKDSLEDQDASYLDEINEEEEDTPKKKRGRKPKSK